MEKDLNECLNAAAAEDVENDDVGMNSKPCEEEEEEETIIRKKILV